MWYRYGIYLVPGRAGYPYKVCMSNGCVVVVIPKNPYFLFPIYTFDIILSRNDDATQTFVHCSTCSLSTIKYLPTSNRLAETTVGSGRTCPIHWWSRCEFYFKEKKTVFIKLRQIFKLKNMSQDVPHVVSYKQETSLL